MLVLRINDALRSGLECLLHPRHHRAVQPLNEEAVLARRGLLVKDEPTLLGETLETRTLRADESADDVLRVPRVGVDRLVLVRAHTSATLEPGYLILHELAHELECLLGITTLSREGELVRGAVAAKERLRVGELRGHLRSEPPRPAPTLADEASHGRLRHLTRPCGPLGGERLVLGLGLVLGLVGRRHYCCCCCLKRKS